MIAGSYLRAVELAEAQRQEANERWKLQIAQPLLDRLELGWSNEEEILSEISYPNMRLFWAMDLGLVERRRAPRGLRWLLGDRVWIRLTRKGWREQ